MMRAIKERSCETRTLAADGTYNNVAGHRTVLIKFHLTTPSFVPCYSLCSSISFSPVGISCSFRHFFFKNFKQDLLPNVKIERVNRIIGSSKDISCRNLVNQRMSLNSMVRLSQCSSDRTESG